MCIIPDPGGMVSSPPTRHLLAVSDVNTAADGAVFCMLQIQPKPLKARQVSVQSPV